jgi:hypothetical protein
MLAVFGAEPALDVYRALREAAVPIDWHRDVELIGPPPTATSSSC